VSGPTEAGAGTGGEDDGDDRGSLGAGGHTESLAAIRMARGPADCRVSNMSNVRRADDEKVSAGLNISIP
jgi:hypothetical protein